ncbi:MAG: DUF192 domain-containing protein [Phycisphaerales bacterium]
MTRAATIVAVAALAAGCAGAPPAAEGAKPAAATPAKAAPTPTARASAGATPPAAAAGPRSTVRSGPTQRSPAGMRLATMPVGAETVTVEIADTEERRQRGLGGRAEIPRGTGMFFHFPMAMELRFWMRDCTVPVDVAFLDRRGVVLSVYAMPVEPPRRADETEAAYLRRLPGYYSRGEAPYALELGGGEMARLGITPGMKLKMPVPVPAAPVGETPVGQTP